MRERMNYRLTTMKKKMTILLVIGIIFGLGCGYFFSQILVDPKEILERLTLVIGNAKIVNRKVFRYCMWQRLIWLLPIGVSAVLGKGKRVAYITTGFLGFVIGMLSMLFVFHFGVKGIVWFLLLVSPQLFLLLPAYIGISSNCMLLAKRQEKMATMELYKIKYHNKNCIVSLIAFLGVMFVGIFAESYINVWIVEMVVNW